MANLFQPSLIRVLDRNGNPVSGARINLYETGTTTRATYFYDQEAEVVGPNPQIADATGLLNPIYLDPTRTYRIVVTNATASEVIYDIDPVRGYDDGMIADFAALVEATAPIVAADKVAAQAAATAAEASAETAADEATNATTQAQLATIARYLSGSYTSDAADFVPQGLTQASVGTITPGSGGTNGTFALAWSGGNFAVNPTGTFTVAGGVLTAVTITGPGSYYGSSPTIPTPSFAASSGLTGAAVALTIQRLVGAGEYYFVPDDTNTNLILYQNVGGVATKVEPEIAAPLTGRLDEILDLFSIIETETIGVATTPVAGSVTSSGTWFINDPFLHDGALKSITINAPSSGTLVFKLATIELSGGTYTATQQGADITLTVVPGLKTYVAGTDFPTRNVQAGWCPAFYTTGLLTHHAPQVAGDGGWLFVSGNQSSTTGASLGTSVGFEFQAALEYSTLRTVDEVIADAIAASQQQVDEILGTFDRTLYDNIGVTGDPIAGVVSASGTWFILDPFTQSGTLHSITINAPSSGTLVFKLAALSGSTTATQQGSDITLTVASGLKTYVAGTDFPSGIAVTAGWVPGFYTTGLLSHHNPAVSGDGAYLYASGNQTTISGSPASVVGFEFQASVAYSSPRTIDEVISEAAGGAVSPPIDGPNFQAFHFLDDANILQVRTIRKSDDLVTVVTDGDQPCRAGFITDDDMVVYGTRVGGVQTDLVVPALGTIAPVPYLPAEDYACWGDSLTAYVQVPSSNYPTQLATLSGREAFMGGVSGENSTQIKSRFLAASDGLRSRIQVFWVGYNNGVLDNWEPATVLDDLAEMIDAIVPYRKRFLVMSVINGSGSGIGTTNYNRIIALNTALASAYPNNYLDIRADIIANGLSFNSISPTTQDLADIAQDVPPNSLRIDFLHGNAFMYARVANRVRNFCETIRGW